MHRFRDRNPSLTNMFASHFCWWDLFPSRFIKTDSSLPWDLRLKISWSSYTRRLRIPPWAVVSVRDAGLYCCAWWTDLTDVELWSSVVRDWVLSALSSLDCYIIVCIHRERWDERSVLVPYSLIQLVLLWCSAVADRFLGERSAQ